MTASQQPTGHDKAEAERKALEEYRRTHSADGYALGSAAYPDNRQGRRALARTWKRRGASDWTEAP